MVSFQKLMIVKFAGSRAQNYVRYIYFKLTWTLLTKKTFLSCQHFVFNRRGSFVTKPFFIFQHSDSDNYLWKRIRRKEEMNKIVLETINCLLARIGTSFSSVAW